MVAETRYRLKSRLFRLHFLVKLKTDLINNTDHLRRSLVQWMFWGRWRPSPLVSLELISYISSWNYTKTTTPSFVKKKSKKTKTIPDIKKGWRHQITRPRSTFKLGRLGPSLWTKTFSLLWILSRRTSAKTWQWMNLLFSASWHRTNLRLPSTRYSISRSYQWNMRPL